jgi:hypothetical protein
MVITWGLGGHGYLLLLRGASQAASPLTRHRNGSDMKQP